MCIYVLGLYLRKFESGRKEIVIHTRVDINKVNLGKLTEWVTQCLDTEVNQE